MKCLRIHGVGDFRVEETEKPRLQDGKVLVKSAFAGVCGTDLAVINGHGPKWSKVPVIPGHEFTGVVEEVGVGVTGVKPGDKVIIDNYLNCNACYYCKKGEYFYCEDHKEPGLTIDGGFGEYCLLPPSALVPLPDGLSLKHATLTEPTANALRACLSAEIQRGEVVVVMGCGPIGAITAMICKAMGARVVVLGRGERFKRFDSMGFELLIDTNRDNWVDVVTREYGKTTPMWGTEAIDKFIDATQTGALIYDAIRILRRKGIGVLMGLSRDGSDLTIPRNDTVFKDIRLVGTTSGQGYFYEAAGYIQRGDVDPEKIITHTFPLSEAIKGVEIVRDRVDGALKVLVEHET